MTLPPVESGDQPGDQPSQQTGEQGGGQGTGFSEGLSLETQNALLAMQQTNEKAMRDMFESFNRQLLEFQERLSGVGLPGSSTTTSATAGPSSAPGTILLPGPPGGGSLSTSQIRDTLNSQGGVHAQGVGGMTDSIGQHGAPASHQLGTASGVGSAWLEGERNR